MTRARWLLAIPILVGVGLVGFAARGCRRHLPERSTEPPMPSASAAPEVRRERRGGTDVTFLVAADTHVGFASEEKGAGGGPRDPLREPSASDRVNLEQVRSMNRVVEKTYPSPLTGSVARPRGVLVAGDLTEDGKPWQWEDFVALYGLRGGDGALDYPVFEIHGNHDKHHSWFVLDRIRERHGANRYAFDWDDLRVISLGEAPDDDGLAFLERELRAVGVDRPIVLYLHFALRGPFSTGNWFADGDYKARLARALFGYNVVGLFHGHYHASGRYQWEGIDVYNVGSTKHDRHSYAVVHVTDTRFTVASWHYSANVWEFWHDKPINGAREPERSGGARDDQGRYLD